MIHSLQFPPDLLVPFNGQHFRLELDDVNECFELIKNMVIDTPAEPFFLSVLQHLLCIRDDVQIR